MEIVSVSLVDVNTKTYSVVVQWQVDYFLELQQVDVKKQVKVIAHMRDFSLHEVYVFNFLLVILSGVLDFAEMLVLYHTFRFHFFVYLHKYESQNQKNIDLLVSCQQMKH